MTTIVHITAHMGGGIGKVLSSTCSRLKKISDKTKHIIVTLEPTENTHFLNYCIENEIPVHLIDNINIFQLLETADIVQIEWWHHPLTMEFMYLYLAKIPTRLIIWSHISGCNYPCIPAQFVHLPDLFIFSTPYSYENPTWNEYEHYRIRDNSSLIISSGFEAKEQIMQKQIHSGFQVGYIGYLGYSKLHPDYVKYCESASLIPDITFTIAGDPSFGTELMVDIDKSPICEKFNVLGYQKDVSGLLSTFDVFGYPLNPDHTGTAENALLEAMAAGVVPVVLNQCSEKYTVKHMVTGLVVSTMKEYGSALRWLYLHPDERKILGQSASKDIRDNYSVEKTCTDLLRVYDHVLHKNKRTHDISQVFGTTPSQWFQTCFVGDLKSIKGIAAGENKSGIRQYLKYFPNENHLLDLVK